MDKISTTLRQNIARNKKSTKNLQNIAKSAGFQMHKNNVLIGEENKSLKAVAGSVEKAMIFAKAGLGKT